ncbi:MULTISPECIES: BadF/BadG/BcrA/BcrD ATPase family protein [unclassified Roseitalea]|uniref:N-acetylglucosamine kinase n=1 Tax=unclassified Roseitalea TaxID=2639107 RepID=UPI00273D278A|nr:MULTISPECIES: BadF/BadG/BcrA/BcrD ATPase family protein [unclassified Roseitalea]
MSGRAGEALALGIDMGGTATRWVLVDGQGRELARHAAPGANGHLYRPEARAAFIEAIAAIAARRPHGDIGAIRAGITGHDPATDDDARAIFASAFGTPAANIRLSDDVALAFRAAFAPGQGHLVSAGTGTVGMSIAPDGAVTRVGGRGVLIDDAGSGAWIGLAALRAVWRDIEERGRATHTAVLADALAGIVGGADWDSARAYVYGRDRGAVGALAPAVADAARAGDETALGILTRAGEEIARLARALIARCGPAPVGLIGGVLRLHPAIVAAIEAALPDAELVFPKIDAAATAARLALEPLDNEATR